MEQFVLPCFFITLIISFILYLSNKDNEKRIDLLRLELEYRSIELESLENEFYEFYSDVKKPFKYYLLKSNDNYVITKRFKKKRKCISNKDLYDNFYEITSKSSGECFEVYENDVQTFLPEDKTNS